MRSKFQNLQDLQRMQDMMNAGKVNSKTLKSPASAISERMGDITESLSDVTAKADKAINKKRKRKKMNEDIGDMSMDLTRRKNRGSGMGTTRSKTRTYGPGSI